MTIRPDNGENNKKLRFWAVVPAAGSGQRFGGTIPKQYEQLHGEAILARSLRTLLESSTPLAGVVVALANNDQRFDTLTVANDKRIIRALGGMTRAESVLKGLQALSGKAAPNDWILVHDAARPLLSKHSLQSLIGQAEILPVNAGAILATPIADTLKRQSPDSGESGEALVEKTIPREHLWAAQTPQMAPYQTLQKALEKLTGEGRANEITDEASALEMTGSSVKLVRGETSNIKITQPEDLRFAEAYMSNLESMSRVRNEK